ncbi:MAG: hypothetical protein KF687_14480 [Cyclobacteriaceae bacterium]|nr:hypothetical protein [Cyclobacteriaceae bacterium]
MTSTPVDKLITEYDFLAKSYLKKLTKYLESNSNLQTTTSNPLKSEEDYTKFRLESLNELCKVLKTIIRQLGKYNKFKTLNPKIIRMATVNPLTQGKFYDFSIRYYKYADKEPELYELIDTHFREFYKLSEKIGLANKAMD